MGDTGIEVLEALPDGDSEDGSASGETAAGIIEEREGVPFINEDALKPAAGTDPVLDRDFKNLVDSVVKQ